ncbi:MAG: hypothetical protein AAFY60_04855 [Myxococcota bacterium]
MKWMAMSALLFCVAACSSEANSADDETAGVEEFSINVEADRSRILEQEEDLQKQQQDVESERGKLEDARREIANRLATLSKSDRKQRAALEAEQKKLSQQERELETRLNRFERERSKLEREKDDLLKRIGKMSESSDDIVGLKQTVATQSRRIGELERTIEKDNKALSQKLDRIEDKLNQVLEAGGTTTRTVVVERSSSSSRKRVGAGEVETAKNAYRRAMNRKGFLLSDLSPTARSSLTSAQSAAKEKDFEQAVAHYRSVESSVNKTRVNKEFIEAKSSRADKAVRAASIPTRKVQPILQKLGAAAADGDYGMANFHLNKIFELAKRN